MQRSNILTHILWLLFCLRIVCVFDHSSAKTHERTLNSALHAVWERSLFRCVSQHEHRIFLTSCTSRSLFFHSWIFLYHSKLLITCNRYVCDWLQSSTLQKHLNGNLWCFSQSSYTNSHGSILKQPAISAAGAGTTECQDKD